MKKYIKMNNNDHYLSFGNLIRVIKEYSINKNNALQTDIFNIIFDTDNINDTTINNYCVGIRSINNNYKQKIIILKNKYLKDNKIMINKIINIISIIDGNIYLNNNLDIINNHIILKDILLKLYNISKNDINVNKDFSINIYNLINQNDLLNAFSLIIFYTILDNKQPLYEDDIKIKVIENILNKTNLSYKDLEEYLNLKLTEGINYNYLIKELASKNNSYACYELGINEYKGYIKGYPRLDKSYDYFIKASNNNHPSSIYMLGKIELERNNYEKAYNYFIKARDLGNIASINSLGLMYKDGLYVKKDLNKAKELFIEATNYNYAYAYNNLGKLEENNNLEKAIEYYLKSANLGESWSCNKIGNYYYNIDQEKALYYYHQSIDSEYQSCCYDAYYNLAVKFNEDYLNNLTIAANHHIIKANIKLLYYYTKEYLNTRDNKYLDMVKEQIHLIETSKDYNIDMKKDIEHNLNLIKEHPSINIDIINSNDKI